MDQNTRTHTRTRRQPLHFEATCSTCRSAGATAYWPADQAGLQQARFTCARCRTLQLELSRNLNAALSRWADQWAAKGLHPQELQGIATEVLQDYYNEATAGKGNRS